MLFNLDYWVFQWPFKFCTLGKCLTLLILILVLPRVYNPCKGLENFSIKDQIVSISGSMGHVVFVRTIQLCYYRAKTPPMICKFKNVFCSNKKFIYKNTLQDIFVPQTVDCQPLIYTKFSFSSQAILINKLSVNSYSLPWRANGNNITSFDHNFPKMN